MCHLLKEKSLCKKWFHPEIPRYREMRPILANSGLGNEYHRTLLERFLALKHLSLSAIYSSSSLNILFLVQSSK